MSQFNLMVETMRAFDRAFGRRQVAPDRDVSTVHLCFKCNSVVACCSHVDVDEAEECERQHPPICLACREKGR